ncbi:crotonase/enoyl-CoA hydratase family protein [Spirosoma pollinicola]|uniref:Enoyl-CoA hydratase n=1 Tax=Spirosoma pollinicola TaxID=2057025 RepID=A0A2K8YZ46_9BACT|nr:crotonase/enoyl-CoA hydratase family protein [Spirosoma pollinicola]AUD02885.1 enoyl-CoA hydratase [Spirosoma pollinicola]
MAEPSNWLNVEQRDNLLFIQLTRPEKRNAINDSLLLSLEAIFLAIPDDVKCVVLYADGAHFSAGLDLSELQERDVIAGLHHSRMWHRVLDRIQFGTVPVVAVLTGACVGGGLEIAAACHIRVAEQSTFYALPEGQRGIFVGGGASVRLPKLIGMARMADMMFTGRVISADEGVGMGLSQYLVPTGEGLPKGIELATKIAQNSPMTNYALMHVLPRIADSNQSEGLMLESLMATIAQSSPEAKQRLSDFLEGRAKKVGE